MRRPAGTACIAAVVLLAVAMRPSAAADVASTRPTAGEIMNPAHVASVMRRAFDYQIAAQASTRPDNGWARSAFYAGVMAAYRATGDEAYLAQARQWAQERHWTPRGLERHADNQCAAQTYVELYLLDRAGAAGAEEGMILPARRVFDAMLLAPRRGREDWSWADALFMSPPVLARLHAATGDRRYLALLDEMWWDATDHLFSPEHGLYFRDAGFFNHRTKSGYPIFWSRGNGWAFAGLARVIEHLPASHPTGDRYVALFQQMAESIVKLQGADGLWQSSLLDPEQFPMPETSGSGFFCFGLAWGINNGHLHRSAYGPHVRRAWEGLVHHVDESGRLGHVQGVGNAPGASRPRDTADFGVAALLLAGAEVMKQPDGWKFDFGRAQTEPGYVAVGVADRDVFTPARGYGWIENPRAELRDRRRPDALRRDYVFGREPATFRVAVKPGTYRLTLVMGEMQYGDHVLKPKLDVEGIDFPEVRPEPAQFATITAACEVKGETLDVTFGSPVKNWIINVMVIEPAEKAEEAKVTMERIAVTAEDFPDSWADTLQTPDPIAPHVERFRQQLESAPKVRPTGLTRGDYLKLIAGNVDYFRQHQNDDGAIVDPFKKTEWQYSTPCFALAAATLVEHAQRDDLVEPAAKAMDWSCRALSQRKAANAHEDFYPPPIAHALPILKKRVAPQRYRRWIDALRSFQPIAVYRSSPGGSNWNVVALSGEYLFHKLGIRDDINYVEACVAAQGKHFDHPYGLYTEGPMPYDHFPRLWAADMVAAGYDGKHAAELREQLRRASLTSLFMQSPTGELPVGGRSAHHQWNEAEQCVTYEIYAAKALADGDEELAGVYKRAAHLALSSMKRWQRPTGELWIVKNYVDPAERHGYEGYSAHSQYNLLAMAMLAIAHHHAAATENIAERPAPADVGGFVLDLRQVFRKVFANAGGVYVEIDTAADPIHNPTGLLRIHRRGGNPQLGPSDGLTAKHKYELPPVPKTTAAVGVAWQDVNGNWKRLAEFPRAEITNVSLLDVSATPDRVSFQIVYTAYFSGPAFISERYVVTPDGVELTVELPDYRGPTRMVWPVLADLGGGKKADVRIDGNFVSTSLDGDTQTFAPVGATSVRVEDELYPGRNGWSRLGVAEYPPGTPAVLRIGPAKR